MGDNKLLKDKKIPILTLDNKWHQLFDIEKKTIQIKRLEHELNKLLKKQGELGLDLKAIQKVKSDNKGELQLQEELLLKEESTIQELSRISKQIEAVNHQLMLESMNVCQKRMSKNEKDIRELTAWIDSTREKLREQIIKHQVLEEQNEQIYTYLHNLLGPGVLEVFDQYHKEKS